MNISPINATTNKNNSTPCFKAIITPKQIIESGSGLSVTPSKMLQDNNVGLFRILRQVQNFIRFGDKETLTLLSKVSGEDISSNTQTSDIAIHNAQYILTGRTNTQFKKQLEIEQEEFKNMSGDAIENILTNTLNKIKALPETKEIKINLFVDKIQTERPSLHKIEIIEK